MQARSSRRVEGGSQIRRDNIKREEEDRDGSGVQRRYCSGCRVGVLDNAEKNKNEKSRGLMR